MWPSLVCIACLWIISFDDVTAAFIGCYVDGGPENRLLLGLQQNFPETLTPEICDRHCFEKGFAYAATQYSFECFCSKTKPPEDKKTADTECNAKCVGDESKTCGGTNRLSVHTTGIREKVDAAYIGCYTDGGPGNRLLHGLQQNYPQTLTPDICIKHCFDKGFAYAGTQYSFECFCGRTKPEDDKKTADIECNAKCVGDESKTCGGTNRLSVHTTGIRDNLGNDAEFRYIGCFQDFSNGTRLMKGYRQDFPDVLNNQLCSRLCMNRGFRYAGMQYGKECFCDNWRPSYKNYAKEEECSKRCEGNFLQLCGGTWRLSVFETGMPDNTQKLDYAGNYIGCYKDQEHSRALSGHEEHFGHILTPLRCTGLCYSMGFLYAGTQYSKQCFCGDADPDPNLKVGEDECLKPCSGDSTQNCGGDFRNSIRETGIPDVPAYEKYMGCFNDMNNHILKGLKTTFEKTNSPRRCMNYCQQLGFKYSGVEYGKECLCGDQEPSANSVVSGDECNMPCSGESLETCGGSWRLAVYSTDTSTTVEPLTNQPATPDPVTNKPCRVSQTTVNGKAVCKGDLIFDDDFTTHLGDKWKHVVKIAETPDYEFAVLQKNQKNCFVSKSNLVFKPTVLNDTEVLTGSLLLQGCTGTLGTRECGYQAFSFNILPPVVSARVNTRHFFSFRYGIVEIKAKLPIGDWLVPELWLEPKTRAYGPHYASGRIRLAMCRGNRELQCDQQDLGINHLESGVVMGTETDVRSRSISSTVPDNWHDHFHTYTLIWKPDSISFKIDDEVEEDIVPRGRSLCNAIGFTGEECATWDSGSNIAPFDTDFYISLGLSSGNARDFPDTCVNRGKPKPWKNLEVKALLKFWQDKENWRATWSDEKSSLYIEHVRVTAL